VADLLRKGLTWLEQMRHEHLAAEVVYRRGSDQVAIKATVGKTEVEQTDEYGLTVKSEVVDFIVRPGDLVVNSVVIEPQPGDQVLLPRDDRTSDVYEVMPLGAEPCYQRIDAYQALRIHTRRIGTEAIP